MNLVLIGLRTGGGELLEASGSKAEVEDTALCVAHTRMPWHPPAERRGDGGCLGCRWLWNLTPNTSVIEHAASPGHCSCLDEMVLGRGVATQAWGIARKAQAGGTVSRKMDPVHLGG